jgi:hypothetical protein
MGRRFASYLPASTSKQAAFGLGIEAQWMAVEDYLNGRRWTPVAVCGGREREARRQAEGARGRQRLHVGRANGRATKTEKARMARQGPRADTRGAEGLRH